MMGQMKIPAAVNSADPLIPFSTAMAPCTSDLSVNFWLAAFFRI